MALLTSDMRNRLTTLLVDEGLVAAEVLAQAEEDAAERNTSIVALLVE